MIMNMRTDYQISIARSDSGFWVLTCIATGDPF